jgi:dihydrolipoamide dehydrogenase
LAERKHNDVLFIGGGPAGYVGAIRAAQLGMKTACVERNRLGGVCLNWGCIPSKALLHNAELYREAVVNASEWGFSFTDHAVDFAHVVGRSRSVTDRITKGVAFLLKKNKVDHIQGHGRITSGSGPHGPCTVEVRAPDDDYYRGGGGDLKQTVTAQHVVIATGAAPRQLAFAPTNGTTIISSYEALSLTQRPASMLIVGSGAIGMEFAYFFNAFGTRVTVVEMLDRILPVEDEDISSAAQKIFTKQGIAFHTGHTVKEVRPKAGGGLRATVAPADGQASAKGAAAKGGAGKAEGQSLTVECDVMLVAIGIAARFDGLFDEGLGIELVKGHIRTDYRDVAEPSYRTSVPGIYAVGDVIGPPWLAHKAMEEAVACVERLGGHRALGIDYKAIPGCTYCNPQVASIGLTERQARELGADVKVGSYKLQSHGKAIAVGATEGLIKVVASKPYGEILGAHIIGEDASELIAEFSLAMRLEATVEDVVSTMHAHPTMHEAVHEAALAVEGRMLHQ